MNTQLKRAIVVFEDSDEDFETIERVINRTGLARTVRATTGEQGLHLLRSPQLIHDTHLVLLDLNMPGLDGRDVLREIKTDKDLRLNPVVVFTTSSNPRDIQFCYSNSANSYHLKVIELHEFEAIVQTMVDYWLDKNVSYHVGVDR